MDLTRICELFRTGCHGCRRLWAWLRLLVSIAAVPATRTSTRQHLLAVQRFLRATLRLLRSRTGSRKTSSRSRSQLTQTQSCSARHQALTLSPSLAVRFATMVRVPVRALAMPNTVQMTLTWLTSGMMNTDITRITSGSIRCSRLASPSRLVSNVITL